MDGIGLEDLLNTAVPCARTCDILLKSHWQEVTSRPVRSPWCLKRRSLIDHRASSGPLPWKWFSGVDISLPLKHKPPVQDLDAFDSYSSTMLACHHWRVLRTAVIELACKSPKPIHLRFMQIQ